jgi:hypothetical protein
MIDDINLPPERGFEEMCMTVEIIFMDHYFLLSECV